MSGSYYTTVDNDMLDAICHKKYGSASGSVERVYKANPDLADQGLVFQAGVTIFLPDLPTSSERTLYQDRLWD